MTARELRGRTVVVSGAGAGLGRALAEAFAREGASLGLVDRHGAALDETLARVRALGACAHGAVADVADEAACAAAVAGLARALGGIDVIVANAGITHHSAVRATSAAVTRRVMDVNFFGAVHCTRAALETLIERRGLVVAISSVAGFAPLLERAAYAASKHALHGWFDTLRAEVEDQGVGVLIVCPAFIATGIHARALGGDGGLAGVARRAAGGETGADEMARRIVAAVRRGDRLALPDTTSRLAWWASRLAPAWFARQMKRRVGAS